MGLQYRKGKVTLNYRDEKPQVYKLLQLTYPAVTYNQLVNECAQSCGVNPSQSKGVIEALINRLVHYMSIGHGVKLGGFGQFKPVFTSKTTQTREEADEKTIKVKKVMFYPGKAFKDMLDDLSITPAGESYDVQE